MHPAAQTVDARPSAAVRVLHGRLSTRLAVSAIVLMALAAVAFWPQYLSKFARADAYTHAHAFCGTLWLVVLIIQPLLIRARRLRAHRLFGRLACVIGAAFVISGVLLAHKSAVTMPAEDFAREGSSLYLPLIMTAIFATAVSRGVAWRRVPAVHARFMASSALPLLDPVFARIVFFYFPPLPVLPLYQVPAFMLVGGILLALYRTLPIDSPGRIVFRNFAVFVTVALLAFFVTPYSETWFAFVQWFRAI